MLGHSSVALKTETVCTVSGRVLYGHRGQLF